MTYAACLNPAALGKDFAGWWTPSIAGGVRGTQEDDDQDEEEESELSSVESESLSVESESSLEESESDFDVLVSFWGIWMDRAWSNAEGNFCRFFMRGESEKHLYGCGQGQRVCHPPWSNDDFRLRAEGNILMQIRSPSLRTLRGLSSNNSKLSRRRTRWGLFTGNWFKAGMWIEIACLRWAIEESERVKWSVEYQTLSSGRGGTVCNRKRMLREREGLSRDANTR